MKNLTTVEKFIFGVFTSMMILFIICWLLFPKSSFTIFIGWAYTLSAISCAIYSLFAIQELRDRDTLIITKNSVTISKNKHEHKLYMCKRVNVYTNACCRDCPHAIPHEHKDNTECEECEVVVKVVN